MKYFIVSEKLASSIGVTAYRQGGSDGYVCMSGDLCGIDVNAAIEEGSVRVATPADVDVFLRSQMQKKEAPFVSTDEPTDDTSSNDNSAPTDEAESTEQAEVDTSSEQTEADTTDDASATTDDTESTAKEEADVKGDEFEETQTQPSEESATEEVSDNKDSDNSESKTDKTE